MTLPLNNYIGCIIGGAVGDALGAPTEFKGTYELQEKYGPNAVNDYIEYEDGKGEITDDTQMLLFTADGLLRAYNRAIEKGDELTLDYAHFLDHTMEPFSCACGSSKCRGLIKGNKK